MGEREVFRRSWTDLYYPEGVPVDFYRGNDARIAIFDKVVALTVGASWRQALLFGFVPAVLAPVISERPDERRAGFVTLTLYLSVFYVRFEWAASPHREPEETEED